MQLKSNIQLINHFSIHETPLKWGIQTGQVDLLISVRGRFSALKFTLGWMLLLLLGRGENNVDWLNGWQNAKWNFLLRKP